jgi:transcriptional regulator with XRE-family HTH domain
MELFGAIGARLRQERERLGRSQAELAGVAAGAGARGATRQSQALYEKGDRAPDAGYLHAVAQAGVDVLYVITGSRDYEPPEALTAEEQVLLEHYRAASRDTRNAALGALLGATATKRSVSNVFHGGVGQRIEGPVHGGDFRVDMRKTKPPKAKP